MALLSEESLSNSNLVEPTFRSNTVVPSARHFKLANNEQFKIIDKGDDVIQKSRNTKDTIQNKINGICDKLCMLNETACVPKMHIIKNFAPEGKEAKFMKTVCNFLCPNVNIKNIELD